MFFNTPMKLFFAVIPFLLVSSLVQAANFSGLIKKSRSNKLQIHDARDGATYNLTPANRLIAVHLSRMSHNDFISFEATRTETDLAISSINYVGLNKLLGAWSSQDGFCFNFSSFTEFFITQKGAKRCTRDRKEDPPYTYLINPSASGWTILIANRDNRTYVANLNFINDSEIEMQLYDSGTGDILRSLKLRK